MKPFFTAGVPHRRAAYHSVCVVLSLSLLFCGCSKAAVFQTADEVGSEEVAVSEPDSVSDVSGEEIVTLDHIPAYAGDAYIAINGNIPFFTESDLTTKPFEIYSELDELGRCGPAFANLCQELMPTEERSYIGMLKPSGWKTVRYDDLIVDKYLYNRCHLVAYSLAGENANEKNLITGTRYLNISGMADFEKLVSAYISITGNHVLYRVTPMFEGDDLVAGGVLMEGYSVEDGGGGICFCIYAYNVQPGITIDYATGESWRTETMRTAEPMAESGEETGAVLETGTLPEKSETTNFMAEQQYIGNAKSGAFHSVLCPNLPSEKNRVYFDSREEAIAEGFHPCGNCNP